MITLETASWWAIAYCVFAPFLGAGLAAIYFLCFRDDE